MQNVACEEKAAKCVVFDELGLRLFGKQVGLVGAPLRYKLTILEILAPPLRAQDEKASHDHICNHGSRAQPPHKRVTNQVYLPMFFDPKILCMRIESWIRWQNG